MSPALARGMARSPARRPGSGGSGSRARAYALRLPSPLVGPQGTSSNHEERRGRGGGSVHPQASAARSARMGASSRELQQRPRMQSRTCAPPAAPSPASNLVQCSTCTCAPQEVRLDQQADHGQGPRLGPDQHWPPGRRRRVHRQLHHLCLLGRREAEGEQSCAKDAAAGGAELRGAAGAESASSMRGVGVLPAPRGPARVHTASIGCRSAAAVRKRSCAQTKLRTSEACCFLAVHKPPSSHRARLLSLHHPPPRRARATLPSTCCGARSRPTPKRAQPAAPLPRPGAGSMRAPAALVDAGARGLV